jgi:hypothetical protein
MNQDRHEHKHKLPHGKIRKCRDFVKQHLRRPHSDLDRFITTWQMGDGSGNQDINKILPDKWYVDLFPIFRMELGGSEATWINEVTQRFWLMYNITLGVEGVDDGDGTDFWEAVVAHMYPGDLSVYKALKPFGVMSYSVDLMAVTPQQYADQTGFIVQGRLRMNFEFRTHY